ncbi:hypothetical protein K2173_012431 [Erythroxylum novogranatense]|uniref:Thaumatin-like protein 1b n=1 Tax=Erythroxylum novogranatense TaxID=1862640 RepID=A0AAV8TJA3_9ROSI|nr:hypothetical protein K2173_012431 [Erythroxylum novogranatense]
MLVTYKLVLISTSHLIFQNKWRLCFSSTLIFTLLSIASLLPGLQPASFKFINRCRHTVWPGLLSGANSPLSRPPASLSSPETPKPSLSPNHGPVECGAEPLQADSSGKFSCLTGDCGSGRFTLNGAGGLDFFDVSLVDGFNLPMLVIPRNGTRGCSSTGCLIDLNGGCPRELKSACEAFGDPKFCCSGAYSTPDTCGPSAYAQFFKHACPRAYSYAYDDITSTYTCMNGNYVIIFCPPPYTSQKLLGARKDGATLPLVNKTMMYISSHSSSPFPGLVHLQLITGVASIITTVFVLWPKFSPS